MRVDEAYLASLVTRLSPDLPTQEYEGVLQELHNTTHDILDEAFTGDYQAPPLYELWHRENCMIYSDRPFLDAKLRLTLAKQRDITDLLHAHVQERRRYEGNVVLEWTGPTGMGKSSCMLGFAEQHNNLQARIEEEGEAALRRRLTIDVPELAKKLDGLRPGDGLYLDEQVHLTGEGSETARRTLSNLEDTLRGTGVDVHFASPGRRDGHGTSQGVLQALSWSPIQRRHGQPGRKEGRFLYWLSLDGQDPLPLGTVRVPWCSPTTWTAYKAIKEEQLDRTRKLAFNPQEAVDVDLIKDVFEHQIVQNLLQLGTPSQADWTLYVRWVRGNLSINQCQTAARMIAKVYDILENDPQMLESALGFQATPAMLAAVDGYTRSARDAEDVL